MSQREVNLVLWFTKKGFVYASGRGGELKEKDFTLAQRRLFEKAKRQDAARHMEC